VYRAEWHEKWTDELLDFVLTVPHAFPALENGSSEQTTLMSAGYTLLFNLLDYTAGVLPVTFVDKTIDDLPPDFIQSEIYKSFNSVAKTAYSVYNVEKMHGLPLGVQVVGRRLEEEKVLEGMQVIESALRESKDRCLPVEFEAGFSILVVSSWTMTWLFFLSFLSDELKHCRF
jgi:Asp-tRNA(Asn)/Glu-tRNA(Gln) amidotransferase A subunit family amidase